MLLWFAVMAPVLVAEIFRSPMVDYRMVVAGALLPVIDVIIGRPTPLHTLLAPVGVLTAVMLATMRRRLLRRRLLGVPIGMMFHLVLDGTWASSGLFWWPVFGLGFEGLEVPELQSVGLRLVLELIAVGAAVWAYQRYGMDQPENRNRLTRTGHLDRRYVS